MGMESKDKISIKIHMNDDTDNDNIFIYTGIKFKEMGW